MTPDMSRAACIGRDPELWFSTDSGDQYEAAAICRTCPVQFECAQLAARHRTIYGSPPEGIWAGRVPPKKMRHGERCVCQGCGMLRFHAARGLCSTCYNRRRRDGTWSGWLELRDQGVSIDDAAPQLGITVNALRKAITRHEAREQAGAA